jgi:hypothetical protein
MRQVTVVYNQGDVANPVGDRYRSVRGSVLGEGCSFGAPVSLRLRALAICAAFSSQRAWFSHPETDVSMEFQGVPQGLLKPSRLPSSALIQSQ